MQQRNRNWAERALMRRTLWQATHEMQRGQPLAMRAVEDVALGAILNGSLVALVLLAVLKFASGITQGKTPV